MRLVLVRHAVAVPASPALSDDARYLSPPGREAARALGARLRAEAVALDAILASPLVRAVQTAELLAAAVGFAGLVEATDLLGPGGSIQRAADLAETRGAAVALVGHEPAISALAAFLTGRPSFPPFRPAQAVLVDDGREVLAI